MTLNIFAKNEKELGKLIQRIRIYSQDIGMEFGILKTFHSDTEKGENRHNERNRMTKQINHQNTWRNRIWEYWKWTSSNKQVLKKRYVKITKEEQNNFFKTNFCNRNLIKGINTWTVPVQRYTGPFLKWKNTDKWTKGQRKSMTMHKALHVGDDIDRLYVSRKDGTGLAIIEDSIGVTIWRFKEYPEKRKDQLIASACSSKVKQKQTVKQQNLENKLERKTTVWIL